MKIRKIVVVAMLLSMPFFICSCAGEGVVRKTFKAPKIDMITCLPSFAGSESIALKPDFKIHNPNDFLVGVNVNYRLEVGGQFIGTSMISTVYIRPDDTIELKDTIIMPFMTWFAAELLSGKSKQEAVMLLGPRWKGLGAKRPQALPEDVWKELPDKKPEMTAEGSILVSTGSDREMFEFTSTWKDQN
jgi:LEA14-like dessication related protein